jgi:hypothetical protein
MNDDEARYLIDQYNEYVSWSERPYEATGATIFILILATLTLFLSLMSMRSTTPGFLFSWLFGSVILPWFIWGFASGVALLFFAFYRTIRHVYRGHERRLLALERYRSRHKSLPDSITLELVVKQPDKAEKLLNESERNLVGSPQT